MVKLFRPRGAGTHSNGHCRRFSLHSLFIPIRGSCYAECGRRTFAVQIYEKIRTRNRRSENKMSVRPERSDRPAVGEGSSSPAAFRRQAAGNAAGNTANSGRLAARRNGSPADSGHRPARPQRAPPAGGQPRRERHPGPALHAAIRSPGPYPSTLRILTRPARRTRRVGAALQIRRRPVRWSEELSGGYAFAFA